MMRSGILSLLAGAAVLTFSLPSVAADGTGKSVCLSMQAIDHTDTPDDYTIIFHMRNHKVWKAAMTDRFFGLAGNVRGYTYTPTMPGTNQICANFLTIRVNDTGAYCIVGDITPVEPAPKS